MRKLKVLRFFCEAWAFRNTFSFFFVSWKCKFTQHATDTNNFSWLLFSLWQSSKFFVQTLFFNLLNLKIRRFFLFLKLDIWLFKLKKWQSIFLTFAVYFLLWISVFLFSIFFRTLYSAMIQWSLSKSIDVKYFLIFRGKNCFFFVLNVIFLY